MCGRFDTSHLYWRDIHEQLSGFGVVKTDPLNLEPNDDVRPTTPQLIARWDGDGWTLDDALGPRALLAERANTFKGAFAKRRCIVPASAWFEWTGEPGSKVKHRFARADGKAIWFAGLWDRCSASDAGYVTSFTIMTGPSAGWLSDYHDRRAGHP